MFQLSTNLTKQWVTKVGLSSNSNRSNSDSEEFSTATTVNTYSVKSKVENVPDILKISSNKTHSLSPRPRSCVDPGLFSKPSFKLDEDVTSIAKKRWSGISLSSKLYQVYDQLACEEDEEYTDSLENPVPAASKLYSDHEKKKSVSSESVPHFHENGPDSLDSNVSTDEKPVTGKRFRKLQRKWEKLSGRESPPSSHSPPLSPTHSNKSKIPRPLASPVKCSGIPVPVSAMKKCTLSNIKPNTVLKTPRASNLVKNNGTRKIGLSTR